MTPEEAKGRVLDFVYGEMPPDEAARFQALMASDPALRAEVEAVQTVREAAQGLGAMPLPVDVRVRLLREAGRYARKRAGRAPAFWSFLERFLLSPAFTGAMVVVVAVGVGVHLLLEMGTEDRLERLERAERAAVSEPGPTEALPAPGEDHAGVVAPAGGAAEADRREKGSAETTARRAKARATPVARAPAEPARERARKKAPEEVGMGPPAPASTPALADRVEAKGARGGKGVSTEALGQAVSGRSMAIRREGGGGTMRLPADQTPPAPAAPPASKAEESEAPQGTPEDRMSVADEALADLARARELKSRGALDAALTAYRKALRAGTLTGSDLSDALAEAAEVAIALKRPDAARTFLDRLKTLPGGPARAAPLERLLERTE